MFHTDVSSASGSLPAPAAAGTPGYFDNGVPGSVPRTIVDADYMNMLMMEVLNVVTTAGLTPSKTTYTQLTAAIMSMVTGGATPAASETVAGKAKIATQALVRGGTDNATILSPLHLFDGFAITGGAGAGSIQLPNWLGVGGVGLKIVWGTVAAASENDGIQTTNFALAFASAVYSIQVSISNPSGATTGAGDQWPQLIDWTLSQVRTLVQSDGDGDTEQQVIYFLAIGI